MYKNLDSQSKKQKSQAKKKHISWVQATDETTHETQSQNKTENKITNSQITMTSNEELHDITPSTGGLAARKNNGRSNQEVTNTIVMTTIK